MSASPARALPPAPSRATIPSGNRRAISARGQRTSPLPIDRHAPSLRLVPPRVSRAPRAPFVLLITGLLGAALIALLFLNAAIAANSFTQRELEQKTAELGLREQQLQREITEAEAPAALAQAASGLGMVPAVEVGFLIPQPDGTYEVRGTPSPAPPPSQPPAPPQREASAPAEDPSASERTSAEPAPSASASGPLGGE